MRSYVSIFIIGILIFSVIGGITEGNLSLKNDLNGEINSKILPLSAISDILQVKFTKTPSKVNLFKSNDKIQENQKSKINKINNNLEKYDFVIITKENLYDAINSSTFIQWKTAAGYSIRTIYTTDDEIVNQEGQDLPNKIRNFLREFYNLWEIKYVLIVGDHLTIPMRYCYPDPSNHYNGSSYPGTGGEVPTDYYYADLSNVDEDSWDSDQDGFYGEFGQDNPDFEAEVYVGRIPTSNPSRITYALNKIVTFEADNGTWKNSALHAGAFYYLTNEDYSGNQAMDAARCMDKIENELMHGWEITHFSEQEGLEKSIYPWDNLNYNSFNTAWRNGKFAIVNWGSHAYMDCAARKIWNWDDGDGVPESNEINWPRFIDVYSNLDDDYPSIVFAMGCLIGSPEPYQQGNLGIDLLTKSDFGASVGIISSTRTPYGALEWPTDPSGCESYCYMFNKYIINESKSIGDALYQAKDYCHDNYGWNEWYEYMNMYIFNLYGDPSLVLEGISVNRSPNRPVLSGPAQGKPGILYNYTFVSTDDDNDNLSYLIEWGDGFEEIIGTYSSGEIVNASHVWNNKGEYILRVRAMDDYSYSEWETLKITMPKVKSFTNSINFQLWMIKQFPIFFSFVNQIF